jgi:hypothetical protein
MRHYLVKYKDSDGYEGETLITSRERLNNNQITESLHEQLVENGIDSRIVQLEVRETNLVVGNIKHFLAN